MGNGSDNYDDHHSHGASHNEGGLSPGGALDHAMRDMIDQEMNSFDEGLSPSLLDDIGHGIRSSLSDLFNHPFAAARDLLFDKALKSYKIADWFRNAVEGLIGYGLNPDAGSLLGAGIDIGLTIGGGVVGATLGTSAGATIGAWIGGAIGFAFGSVPGALVGVQAGTFFGGIIGGALGGLFGGAIGDGIADGVNHHYGFPLIFDLDGDGVETTNAQNSAAFFNYGMDVKTRNDQSGVFKTGWVGKDDGILVYDWQGDGRITDANEIVLTSWNPGAKSDLEGLAGLDANKDGKITLADAAYGKLKIWRDANQNGLVDANEMYALSAYGITFIGLTGDGKASVQEGNIIVQQAQYGTQDGALHSLGDVGFGFELREYERAMVQNGAPSSLPRRAEEEVQAHQLHDLPPVPNAGPAPLPVTRPAQVVREEAAPILLPPSGIIVPPGSSGPVVLDIRVGDTTGQYYDTNDHRILRLEEAAKNDPASAGVALTDLLGDLYIAGIPDADAYGSSTNQESKDSLGGDGSALPAASQSPVVARTDEFAGREDISLELTAGQLLANDAGDAPIRLIGLAQGEGGVVSYLGDGRILFTPGTDFYGDAWFSYGIEDANGAIAQSQVVLHIEGVNDAPLAANERTLGEEDVGLEFSLSDLLANDRDVDGDVLAILWAGNAKGGKVQWVSNETGAVVSFGDAPSLGSGGGTYRLLFTPDVDYNGIAGFDYRVGDGKGGEDVAHVTIDLAAINDAPVLIGEQVEFEEDTRLFFDASDLLRNDWDIEGNGLSIIAVGKSHHGAVDLWGEGRISFDPDLDYNGDADFWYQVSDGQGGESWAQVVIHYTPVNDTPRGNDIAYVDEDNGLIFQVGDLLKNDVDPEGDTFELTHVGKAFGGQVQLLYNGQVVFTPDTNFYGLAGFQYTVTDQNGAEGNIFVSVYVNPVNDAPWITGYDKNAGRFRATDVDGDPLRFFVAQQGDYVHLTVDSNGYLTGFSEPANHPADTFVIGVIDPSGAKDYLTFAVAAYSEGGWTGQHYPDSHRGQLPIVLDLNRDGALNLIGAQDSQAYIDYDHAGSFYHSGWVGAEDGLLILDLNQDRQVTDSKEFVFTQWTEAQGLTDMQAVALVFDSNKDGWLDPNDQRFLEFSIWQDANGDGKSQAGEIRTLAEWGITALDLRSDGMAQDINGNHVSGTSHYLTSDNFLGLTGDVSLSVEDVLYHSYQGLDSLLDHLLPAQMQQAAFFARPANAPAFIPVPDSGPEEGAFARSPASLLSDLQEQQG